MRDQSCASRYPLLLVHGAGFRDLKRPLYWGRIPGALTARGAAVFYGRQDSWGCIADNARALVDRIREILRETGAKKVNIISHSKGGLEARMAASSLGAGDLIASVTTVVTPHRGSITVDTLMKAPRSLFSAAAFAVDNWIRVVGDRKPDFLRVCEELTTERMAAFNRANPDCPDVLYRSFACVMSHPFSDINLSTANYFVGRIEGENDGLVTVESALWGEDRRVLRSGVMRGISHLDAIDLRRAPLTRRPADGVRDIVEVYIDMAAELKRRGL